MKQKRCVWIGILCSILCVWGCDSGRGTARTHHAPSGDSIRIAIAAGTPSDLVIGGLRYGYCCDLLQAYCDSLGVALCLDGVSDGAGEASLQVLPATGGRRKKMVLLSTHYVVLAAAGETPVVSLHELAQRIGGQRVWLAAGFQHTQSYDDLRDLLPATELCVAADGTEPFGELLADGIDFLICEQGEAAMAAAVLGGMTPVFRFPEEVRIGLSFTGGRRPAWASGLNGWLAEWRRSGAADALRKRYEGTGFAASAVAIVPACRVIGGISEWDALFRKVGDSEGVDWRLLAAIAYHESRFRAAARSRAGAVGMMQIMPVTAQHLGVSRTQLADPETNIRTAARLLEEIEVQLELSDGIDAREKLFIVLAAYNSGVGTVRNARRLAEAAGNDTDLWETVARYLALMGDRNYRNDSIRYRHFIVSSETLAFVEDVAGRYETYCRNVQ